ncbi:MAG: class I SAM-dependent methyltransferase [Cytophagales bacterium]|nr:class I SAM-dependent methyltransferase [Cytophagales bacterium]
MKRIVLVFLDIVLFPLSLLAAPILWAVRRIGVERLPICKKALLLVGVFPIRRHYYEPLFDTESLREGLSRERDLPGIDLNVAEQLDLLSQFSYAEELLAFPLVASSPETYFYHNSRFGPGDAEFLYSMIRRFKPQRLVEIGSGFSTLMARHAIAQNEQESPGLKCDHVCIEPYEEPWLEKCGAKVLRQRVEVVDPEIFLQLEENDILFIDSSHMIRPGGDVLFEYLQVLPRLKPGVLVHVHDIFTPHDYPALWVTDEIRFWNEQYLLEAFLCHNRSFKILGALNYLKRNYPKEIAARLPVLGREMENRDPASFWMRRL